MLKNFKMRDKKIPIPVPLKNLFDAMEWIEKTFSGRDQVLTFASIDGKDILSLDKGKWRGISLDEHSELEVRVDSPRELSVQTVEAVRDLSQGILSRIQAVAVKCWESESNVYLTNLREIAADIELVRELVAHVSGIIDYTHKEMAPVGALSRLLRYPAEDLIKSMRLCNWKACSHILLNRIEPLLRELAPESEQLQIRVLSSEDDHGIIPERKL